MPGSTITCQGLSSAYNSQLTSEATFNFTTNTVELPVSASGKFAVLGDVVYTNRRESGGHIGINDKYFLIPVTATSVKLAKTYLDAVNNVPIIFLQTFVGQYTYLFLSNYPDFISPNTNIHTNQVLNKDFWQSSAFSAANFAITERVQFDFTVDEKSTLCGISTISGSYAIGIGYVLNTVTSFRSTDGDVGNFGAIWAPPNKYFTLRMTLQNRIITIASRELNGSYTNRYSTAPINTSEPLRFFAFFGINNSQVTNCTLTRL